MVVVVVWCGGEVRLCGYVVWSLDSDCRLLFLHLRWLSDKSDENSSKFDTVLDGQSQIKTVKHPCSTNQAP